MRPRRGAGGTGALPWGSGPAGAPAAPSCQQRRPLFPISAVRQRGGLGACARRLQDHKPKHVFLPLGAWRPLPGTPWRPRPLPPAAGPSPSHPGGHGHSAQTPSPKRGAWVARTSSIAWPGAGGPCPRVPLGTTKLAGRAALVEGPPRRGPSPCAASTGLAARHGWQHKAANPGGASAGPCGGRQLGSGVSAALSSRVAGGGGRRRVPEKPELPVGGTA